MITFLVILGILLGLVVGWVVFAYNRFVRQRQFVDNSWSSVDTELQRRYDLIPNLVESVRGYATHEESTLEAVIQARSAAVSSTGSADEQAVEEKRLVTKLQQLLALSERYPDLRASHHFLELQRQLVVTEDRIQASRRIYNGNVRKYNNRVDAFPSMAIARAGRFTRAPYFEVEPAARAVPSVAPPA